MCSRSGIPDFKSGSIKKILIALLLLCGAAALVGQGMLAGPAPITHVTGACSQSTGGTYVTNVQTFSCTPQAANDAIVFQVYCHDTSGTISSITLAASGWTITPLAGLVGWNPGGQGAEFGAIAPNTSPATFTATATGASDCMYYGLVLSDEFSGNNTAGGASTFESVGSAGGTSGGCNQSSANVTPLSNNDAVWFACVDNSSGATSPWIEGANDGGGNDLAEYQLLSGGAGIPQTPAFTGTSGQYTLTGVAIAP
jgi:hypothetical protein